MGVRALVGDLRKPVIRRLLGAAAALVLARRLATKVASALGHRLPPAPPPLESERPPGWMPRRQDP